MKDNNLFKFIKYNFIHLILAIQVFIFVTADSYYTTSNVDLGDIIIIMLSILFTIISFFVETYNYREKDIIYRFNIMMLLISIFMIVDVCFSIQEDNS